MEDSIIKTRNADVWVENDILYCKLHHNTEVTLRDARKMVQIAKNINHQRKLPVLADLTEARSMSRDARKYFSSSEAEKYAVALALITDSVVGSVIGNFFLRINNPPYPVRLFSEEKAAIKWLKSFVSDVNGK